MLKSRVRVFQILALAAIWVGFECWISWAAFCNQASQYGGNYKPTKEDDCVFRGPTLSILRWFFNWFRHTFDGAEAYIALFTAVLFVATVLLWWSTRDLVKGAEETAERQLRAYIAISKLRIRNVKLGSKPVAVIRLKNSGQTPAYDFKGNFGLGLFPYPFKDIHDPPTARELSVMDIGPNQAVVARAELGGPLEQKHIDALRDGRGAMLLVGHVTYRDVFGEDHRIDVRLRYTSQTFGTNKMEVCPEGNKST